MKNVAHTLPFLIRSHQDLTMASLCFHSLSKSDPGALVVLYNQGGLSNQELQLFLRNYDLQVQILGDGKNVGIAPARMACFVFIWENYPSIDYISEIHVDMIFPKKWVCKLVDFLENTEEPMICPGILTLGGELHPEGKGTPVIKQIPLGNHDQMDELLCSFTSNGIVEGFVHPVLHKSKILKKIGGYDLRFLKGKQGYEDDVLLLNYRYFMGTRFNWRPKCLLSVRVFHATLFQRMSLPGKEKDFEQNLRGLIYQFGLKGLIELCEIHQDNTEFPHLVEHMTNSF